MFGLAIAARELDSLARRRATHVLQMAQVLLLSLVVIVPWAAEWGGEGRFNYAQMSRVGRDLFGLLYVAQLLLVLLLAPALTGGVIAEERRRGTLELLFVTPMGELELVFGKFVARMAQLLFHIVLAAPVLFGCMVFGGVSASDVLLATALLVAVATWSGAVGFLCSTLSRTGLQAICRAYLLLLPALLWFVFRLTPSSRWFETPWFGYFRHVDFFFFTIFLGFLEPASRPYSPSVAGGTILGALLLVSACAPLLRRVRRAGSGGTAGANAKQSRPWARGSLSRKDAVLLALAAVCAILLPEWDAGMVSKVDTLPFTISLAAVLWVAARVLPALLRRSTPPPGPMGDNPIAWWARNSPRWHVARLAVDLALLGLAWLVLHSFAFHLFRDPSLTDAFTCIALELCACVGALALQGLLAFPLELDGGRLELLLATPLGAARIVTGMGLGIAIRTAPLICFLLLHAFTLLPPTSAWRDAALLALLASLAAYLYLHLTLSLFVGLLFRRVAAAIGFYACLLFAVYAFYPTLVGMLMKLPTAAGQVSLRLSPLYWVSGALDPMLGVNPYLCAFATFWCAAAGAGVHFLLIRLMRPLCLRRVGRPALVVPMREHRPVSAYPRRRLEKTRATGMQVHPPAAGRKAP
ncbi:MAG: ABC transporter permease subunit [Planctomycetes bacterium]|nr:ABC transporter permease subunit [Planctomycetota bacterium]